MDRGAWGLRSMVAKEWDTTLQLNNSNNFPFKVEQRYFPFTEAYSDEHYAVYTNAKSLCYMSITPPLRKKRFLRNPIYSTQAW